MPHLKGMHVAIPAPLQGVHVAKGDRLIAFGSDQHDVVRVYSRGQRDRPDRLKEVLQIVGCKASVAPVRHQGVAEKAVVKGACWFRYRGQ